MERTVKVGCDWAEKISAAAIQFRDEIGRIGGKTNLRTPCTDSAAPSLRQRGHLAKTPTSHGVNLFRVSGWSLQGSSPTSLWTWRRHSGTALIQVVRDALDSGLLGPGTSTDNIGAF